MNLPLYTNDIFGTNTGLVFAAVIGFFFGGMRPPEEQKTQFVEGQQGQTDKGDG